jgi:hypothetical protein
VSLAEIAWTSPDTESMAFILFRIRDHSAAGDRIRGSTLGSRVAGRSRDEGFGQRWTKPVD